VAEALFAAFGKRMESVTLISSGGGLHEITANGKLIFSKKQTGQQPTPAEIVAAVKKMM
jgi:selT/selW/selH-like putative selenoprotein